MTGVRLQHTLRNAVASSSRLPNFPHSYLSHRFPPFFTAPIFLPQLGNGHKGKGRNVEDGKPPAEEEVSDAEWELRVGRAMRHLRETLPQFFYPLKDVSMYPSEIFSQSISLKLPPPLPLKISSLQAYSLAFALARNGMHALHTDLHVTLNRMTLSPSPTQAAAGTSRSAEVMLRRRRVPTHREKQVRILLSAHGTPRLPPHKEATWQTSSLYTFSPVTGLIQSHEVEAIRPLPGEGVAEWLLNRLWGWRGQIEHHVPQPSQASTVRCERTEGRS